MEWKKKMKKFEWNDLVFFASLAVYLGYYLLFWNVFDNDVLYWKYNPFCWNVLFATSAVNAVCQVIALSRRNGSVSYGFCSAHLHGFSLWALQPEWASSTYYNKKRGLMPSFLYIDQWPPQW